MGNSEKEPLSIKRKDNLIKKRGETAPSLLSILRGMVEDNTQFEKYEIVAVTGSREKTLLNDRSRKALARTALFGVSRSDVVNVIALEMAGAEQIIIRKEKP